MNFTIINELGPSRLSAAKESQHLDPRSDLVVGLLVHDRDAEQPDGAVAESEPTGEANGTERRSTSMRRSESPVPSLVPKTLLTIVDGLTRLVRVCCFK